MGSMAGGAVLVFVGLALMARHIVRPVAALAGWPLERAFHTPGRLARENAMRNPGRTATTSSALMVGLGLVVFVAVFAAGMKATVNDSFDRLMTSDLIVTSVSMEPLPNAALDTSPEALAADLDLMDSLTNWMNARRAYAQQFVEGGGIIPGYQLVDKRGTRKWIEDNEAKAAGQIAKALKLDPADLFVSKLKSPAQVEKLIPSTLKKRLEPFWQMVVSGTNLVRSDKTTRPPVGGIAQRWFNPNPMEDL